MARVEKTMVVVQCAMFDEELPALDKPPFPGSLGERIYNEVSSLGYRQWSERATLLVNHYGLNMADPRSQEFLFQQMEDFFFGDGGAPISGGAPGKGAPQK